MNDMQKKIAKLAANVAEMAQTSGLTWDEAIGGLGLAAKGLAVGASCNGDGDEQSCVAHARKRFEEGLAQEVVQVAAGSDLSKLREVYSSSDRSMLAGARIRVVSKF